MTGKLSVILSEVILFGWGATEVLEYFFGILLAMICCEYVRLKSMLSSRSRTVDGVVSTAVMSLLANPDDAIPMGQYKWKLLLKI